ncbi:hypothetical protein SynA1544_01757 [Synechococcus sp. A15-44]|nr:hypothetical protein SynA1544_01757 [Synechococcus sp. A15-44]
MTISIVALDKKASVIHREASVNAFCTSGFSEVSSDALARREV